MQKGDILAFIDSYPKLLPTHSAVPRSRTRPLSPTLSHILEAVQRELGFKFAAKEDTNCVQQIEEVEFIIEQVASRF